MDIAKIRSLSDQDLRTQEVDAREQLFRGKFQKSLGNQDGHKQLRMLKLDIARLQTIASERSIEAKREPAVKALAPAASQRTARKRAKRG